VEEYVEKKEEFSEVRGSELVVENAFSTLVTKYRGSATGVRPPPSPHSWRGFVASSHSLLHANFLRNAVSAYTIHIMPDDKSIPSSASLAYRDGAMPNFAF
jgi:hypothetical protein